MNRDTTASRKLASEYTTSGCSAARSSTRAKARRRCSLASARSAEGALSSTAAIASRSAPCSSSRHRHPTWPSSSRTSAGHGVYAVHPIAIPARVRNGSLVVVREGLGTVVLAQEVNGIRLFTYEPLAAADDDAELFHRAAVVQAVAAEVALDGAVDARTRSGRVVASGRPTPFPMTLSASHRGQRFAAMHTSNSRFRMKSSRPSLSAVPPVDA